MITGIAISVEPAMTAPQSVPRLTSVNVLSQTGRVFLLVAGHHDQREGELVPRLDEPEDAGRDQPGRQQREGDPEERLDPRAAVDHRGLLQLERHAGDEAAQRPDREGQHARRRRPA